jgi:hypothetical protein
MSGKSHPQYLFAALLVCCSFIALEAQPRRLQRMPPGTWGGEHIKIEVAPGSATIEYDCAHGTLDGPLQVDRHGRFNLRGKHMREHGGPIRVGLPTSSRAVKYTGSIKGRTMKLTVTFTDTKAVMGTFTLERGASGFLRKCR